jgi:plastocyanin
MTLHDRNRPCVALLTAAFLAALVSCNDNPAGGGDGGDGTFNGTIRVLDNRFSPSSVTVSVGDSVTWRWDGYNSHSVEEGTSLTNPSPLFNSGIKSSGTFGYRFNVAGSYPYFCRLHFSIGMKGNVTVESP